MQTLNEIVKMYLEKNGIMINFFANFIGCEQAKCSRWLRGESKLNPNQIRKTHEFLEGKHIKTVDEILKEE